MPKALTATPILVIDDDLATLHLMKFHLEDQGYEVATAATGEQGLQLIQQQSFALALTDLQLPDFDGIELIKRIKADSPATECIMITGYGDSRATAAKQAGAFYFAEKPVDFDELLYLIEKAVERWQQDQELSQLRNKLRTRTSYYNIIGSSRAMEHVYEIIESVAESDANVLIIGESGTGKELVASAIHYRSLRAKQPFMQVNCAALPKELIESELFGHTKGAFTGAAGEKVGLIGRAAGGSLLLDEIGEMPLELQPKLLRVLQERVYYRLGSEKPLSADFRLVAATNRNPLDAIRDGHLREDLYYRLNTIELHVPPLRERMEDTLHLADHFLRHYAEKYQRQTPTLSQRAYEELIGHQWPGNVRELQNTIERAVLLSKDGNIETLNLPVVSKPSVASVSAQPVASPIPAEAISPTAAPIVPQTPAPPWASSSLASPSVSLNAPLLNECSIEQLCRLIISKVPEPKPGGQLDDLFKQLEVHLAQAAVERTGGNKQAAANLLGIYRPRLYSLLKKGAEQNGAAADPAVTPADNASNADTVQLAES